MDSPSEKYQSTILLYKETKHRRLNFIDFKTDLAGNIPAGKSPLGYSPGEIKSIGESSGGNKSVFGFKEDKNYYNYIWHYYNYYNYMAASIAAIHCQFVIPAQL